MTYYFLGEPSETIKEWLLNLKHVENAEVYFYDNVNNIYKTIELSGLTTIDLNELIDKDGNIYNAVSCKWIAINGNDYNPIEKIYSSIANDYSNMSSLILPNLQIIGTNSFKNVCLSNYNLYNVKSISSNAFDDFKNTEITLDNAENLDEDAFKNTNLTALIIPKAKNIEDYMFNNDNKISPLLKLDVSDSSSPYSIDNIRQNFYNWFNDNTTLGFNENLSIYLKDYNIYMVYQDITRIGEGNQLSNKYILGKIDSDDINKNVNYVDIGSNTVNEIDNGCFKDCRNLYRVTIPNTVLSIDESAFENSSISTISIPNNVQKLSKKCFKDSDLIGISYPNTIIDIEESCFQNTKLSSFAVPEHMFKLKESTFESCDITNLSTNNILSIEDNCFNECIKLSSVSYLYNIKNIGKKAFRKTNLSSLIFNEEKFIDDEAFESISALKYIKFYIEPKMGNAVFKDCNNLTSIYQDSDYLSIGTNAFENCNIQKLDNIYVDVLSDNAFLNNQNLTSINMDWQVMGNNCFKNCNVKNITALVTLRDTGFSIGNNAFENNTNLLTVDLQDVNDVPTLGTDAFKNTNDTYKILVNGSKYINYISSDNWKDISSHIIVVNSLFMIDNNGEETMIPYLTINSGTTFQYYNQSWKDNFPKISDVSKLKGFRFSGTVPYNSFGASAFRYCTNLSSDGTTIPNIPNTITSFGEYCFANTNNIKEYVVPTNIKTLEKHCFENSQLTSITFAENCNATLCANCFERSKIKNVYFNGSTNYIYDFGNYAFYGCTDLTSFQDNLVLRTLGDYCFSGCIGLTYFNLESNNLNNLQDAVFNRCTNLEHVRVKLSNLKSIGNYAFSNCTKLKDIQQYASSRLTELTSIGYGAFQNCSELTNMYWDNSTPLQTIGSEAFINCTSLKYLPTFNTLTEIGNKAFRNSGISSFQVGYSLQNINMSAFCDCSSLTSFSIGYYDSPVMFGNACFKNCINLQSVNDYYKRNNSHYLNDSVFENCSKLQSFSSEYITSIGEKCFKGCSIINNINLTNTTSIGNNAFADCSSLNKLTCYVTVANIQNKYRTWGLTANSGCVITGRDGTYTIP